MPTTFRRVNSVIPFLERNRQYWGLPADDITAINELERLRKSGPRFIVFAPNSFWWFEYYQEFGNHLRSKYQCVVENDRLIAFALK